MSLIPKSTDEDFHSFLMRQGVVPEKKANGPDGKLANEQVSPMILADLSFQIAFQKEIPPSALSSDALSGEPTSAIPVPFDLTEHPTITPFLFFQKQEGTSVVPPQNPSPPGEKGHVLGPLDPEELTTSPLQSSFIQNQNGQVPGLPFFEDSFDPAWIKTEIPGLTEPPGGMAQPRLYGAVSPAPVEPLRIIPPSQFVSSEEGLHSVKPHPVPFLDRPPMEPPLHDLQKPPVQIIDRVATEPLKPAEMMIAGEQSRLHREGAGLPYPVPKEIPQGQERLMFRAEQFEIYQQIAKRVVWSVQNNEDLSPVEPSMPSPVGLRFC